MKAEDITDEMFLNGVRELRQPTSYGFSWVNRFDLAEHLGFPPKVVLAKARRLIRRNLLDGCDCGCRGDFEVRA